MTTRLDMAKKNAHLLMRAFRDKAIEIFGPVATEDAMMAMWLAADSLAKVGAVELRTRFRERGDLFKALEQAVDDA